MPGVSPSTCSPTAPITPEPSPPARWGASLARPELAAQAQRVGGVDRRVAHFDADLRGAEVAEGVDGARLEARAARHVGHDKDTFQGCAWETSLRGSGEHEPRCLALREEVLVGAHEDLGHPFDTCVHVGILVHDEPQRARRDVERAHEFKLWVKARQVAR